LAEDTPFFVQACDTSGNCTAKLDKNDYLVGSPPPQFVNRVGEPHTFWIAVWKDDGTGLVPAQGVIPIVTLIDRDGDPVPDTDWTGSCKYGTGPDGKCQVIVESTQPGPISASATADIQVLTKVLTRSTNGEIGNSLEATKIYVDATLELLESGSASIDEEYTVIATVMKNLGRIFDPDDPTVGYEPAQGEEVTFTIIDPNGGDVTPTENTCETDEKTGSAPLLSLQLQRELSKLKPLHQ
jgi:hypothetical protein